MGQRGDWTRTLNIVVSSLWENTHTHNNQKGAPQKDAQPGSILEVWYTIRIGRGTHLRMLCGPCGLQLPLVDSQRWWTRTVQRARCCSVDLSGQNPPKATGHRSSNWPCNHLTGGSDEHRQEGFPRVENPRLAALDDKFWGGVVGRWAARVVCNDEGLQLSAPSGS